MGKKKNKNQTLGMGKKPPTVTAKKAGKNKLKNGFGQKNLKFKDTSGTPETSKGQFSQEFVQKKQGKKKKNQIPKIPVPEAANGTGQDRDSRETIPESMKRQKQGGSKGPKAKKIKRKMNQPGQFVRATPEEVKNPKKVQKKKKEKGTTDKTKKSLEIAVCESPKEEFDTEDSENSYDEPYQSFLDQYLGSESFDSSSEEDYSQSSSYDEYDSFSDEECEEEFSTDTDYSENVSEVSSYSEDFSDDDVEYFPGDQYDDVIVRKGEAKYREILPSKVKFSNETVSEIIEYFSDEEETRKKVEPIKPVDPTLDTSKAVVQAGSVHLDGHAPADESEKERKTPKMKKIVCSKDCSHDHIPSQIGHKKSSGESPLDTLRFTESGEEVEKDESEKPEEATEEIPDLDATDLREEDEHPEGVKFYNAIDSYHVLLHLKESINFHGNLNIKLIAGSASVLEYPLDLYETVTANAPVGYSTVNITPGNASNPREDWKNSLEKENKNLKEIFFESDLKEIEENLSSSQAVLLLNKISNNRVKMVEKYSATRIFPNMITYKRSRPFASTEFILQCRFSCSNNKNFQVNPQWEEITVAKDDCIMAIGGKNVGKSCLIRHLINKNLKRFGKILLIDLDIGQPEIFLPQTVSATLVDHPILGMGCFVEKQPETSRLFGGLNVANDPVKYYNSVFDLQQDIKDEEKFREIPWFINTMGYAKGVGMELMIALIGLFRPSHVLQIDHEIQLENFECEFTKKFVDNWEWQLLDISPPSRECSDFKIFHFHTMVSGSLSDDIRRSKASETRQINILAHLGGALGDDCEWITQSQPVCVPLDKITILNLTDEDIDDEHKLDLINSNLVYLCNNSFENPKVFGLGIVRGIDNALKNLYLLPTTRESLNQVDSLAVCAITLPPQLILNQSSSVQGELPYVYNTDEAIGSRTVVGRAFRDEKAITNMYSKNLVE